MKRKKWMPSSQSRICSEHFSPDCFDRTGQTTRLRDDAEPTVFNFPPHLRKIVTEQQNHLLTTAVAIYVMLRSLPYDVTTWLVAAVTAFLAYLIVRRPRGIPPGPRLRLPLLGYLPFVKGDLISTFRELRKSYGDIFHIYMGQNLVVVLNGYDVIKEAFVDHANDLSDRPPLEMYKEFGAGQGIFFSCGLVWKENRRVVMQAMRLLGLGRNIMQEKILEEVTTFLSSVEDENGQPFDIKTLLHTAVSNVTNNIIFGKRFHYDDPKFQRYLQFMECYLRPGFFKFGLRVLRSLPGDVTGYKAAKGGLDYLRQELIDASVKEHLDNFQPDIVSDLIDVYIKAMKEEEKQRGTRVITEDHLWAVILDLFVAGTETTATAIRWALVYLLNYPHIQDRIYSELQQTVGCGRLPTLEDEKELPFLNAFILEVLRHANLVPLAAPHSTVEDTVFRGFRIPKGTWVHPNFDSVLKDPKVWRNPDTFQPERFLENGKLVKLEQLIPFGIGRRICLGESLARIELFLFLSAMIQRFRFECGESYPPSEVRDILGIIRWPQHFLIRAIRRQ